MSQKKKHPYSLRVQDEGMDSENLCGVGSFRPQWLQAWGTPKVYLAWFCTVGVIQGIYFSYLIAILTTLEKRFGIDSKVSTSITVFDEFTPLIFGIPVGYISGRINRPRFMFLGLMMGVLASFLSALPYFIYGPAKNLMVSDLKNETTVDFCTQEKYDYCSEDQRPRTHIAIGCLFFASFLKGFSGIACLAGGLTYLDDYIKKKNVPIYFAIAVVLRLLGPVFGFLVSAAFLKYNENPLVDPGFGPEDPRWIGAWWLGFVVHAIILFIVSLPALLFPNIRSSSVPDPCDVNSNKKRDFKKELKGLSISKSISLDYD